MSKRANRRPAPGSSSGAGSDSRASQCRNYYDRPSCGWTEFTGERCERNDDGSLGFYCCCTMGVPPPPPPSPNPPPASPPLPPRPPRVPPSPMTRSSSSSSAGLALLTSLVCTAVVAAVACVVVGLLLVRRRRRWDAQSIQDHYAIIGVHEKASFEQIRSAYLDLARPRCTAPDGKPLTITVALVTQLVKRAVARTSQLVVQLDLRGHVQEAAPGQAFGQGKH